MAALPNGCVGGGTCASSFPARPPARVDRSAPQVPRAFPGRRRAPPGSRPTAQSLLLWVRALLQPSGARAASGRQSLADGRAGSAADLSLCPSAWFCCCGRGRQAPHPAPRSFFYYHPLPQHCHWRVWAKPPPFCLRWRNVPGTRRNERTGVGLHGNWKKEVGYKSIATLL